MMKVEGKMNLNKKELQVKGNSTNNFYVKFQLARKFCKYLLFIVSIENLFNK
jgi:hypothetical protein